MSENPQSERGTKPGDVTWVRFDRRSRLWWPAQVVEENRISGKWKRKRRAVGDVLVRLYGTYSYLYTNPSAEVPEFEMDLRRCGINAREAFQRALEKDMAKTLDGPHEKAEVENLNAGINSEDGNCAITVGSDELANLATERKAKTSKSNPQKRKVTKAARQSPQTAVTKVEGSELEGSYNAGRISGIDNSESVKTPSSSIRRMRIMQNLGLIAPSGSPFKLHA